MKAAFFILLGLTPFKAFSQVTTVITGLGEGTIIGNYTDNYLVKHKMNVSNRSVSLSLSNPLVVYFSGKGEMNFCVLLPGETVVYERVNSEFQVKGTFQHTLNFSKKLSDNGLSLFGPPDFMGLDWEKPINFQALSNEFYSLRSERMKLLESEKPYLIHEGKSYEWYQNEIDLAYARTLLLPMSAKLFQDKDFDPQVLPQSYRDSIEVTYKRLANKHFALKGSYSYRSFVTQYTKYETSLSSKINANQEFEMAKSLWKGDTKEFVLFSIVNSLDRDNDITFPILRLRYIETQPDTEYIRTIDKIKREQKERKTALSQDKELLDTELVNYAGEIITWKDLLLKSKGRFIYMDMWASWCVPCIQEIPNSISLRHYFDNKDLVMLYVSIDSNEQKWRKAMNKFSAVQDETQYLLNPKSKLAKALTQGAVPRYILFDPDGKVANLNAPRPGSSTVVAYLREVLGK